MPAPALALLGQRLVQLLLQLGEHVSEQKLQSHKASVWIAARTLHLSPALRRVSVPHAIRIACPGGGSTMGSVLRLRQDCFVAHEASSCAA